MCTAYIASVLTGNCLIWGNDIQLARCQADYNQTTDNQKQNIYNNYIGMTEKQQQQQRLIKFIQIIAMHYECTESALNKARFYPSSEWKEGKGRKHLNSIGKQMHCGINKW